MFALDVEHVELADNVAEYDRAVEGPSFKKPAALVALTVEIQRAVVRGFVKLRLAVPR